MEKTNRDDNSAMKSEQEVADDVIVEFSHHPPVEDSWGWAVVVAAFFIHLVTHGILYSFGSLFITFQDAFSAPKAEVAWIGSIATGLLYLVGPVAGYFTTRYGCRAVTVVGAFIGSAGYIISMFATNLYVLYITMGFLTGCGFGLMFLVAIVAVTQHFVKNRSLACSIALCGAGGGAFLFSPLIKWLIDVFSWRGALLIQAGIILNCLVCSLIYRPASDIQVTDKHKQVNDSTVKGNGRLENQREEETQLLMREPNKLNNTDGNVLELTCLELASLNKNRNKLKDVNDVSNTECVEDSCGNCSVDKFLENSQHSSEIDKNNCDKYAEDVKQTRSNDPEQFTHERRNNFIDIIFIFKSKRFTVFGISQFLFFVGFYMPFVYIPDKAQKVGIDVHTGVWIVSTIGLSSIVGRIVFGYLADRPSVNRLLLFKTALLMTGVSTVFGPLFNQSWIMFVYAVIYGVSTGTTLALTSVVLVDLMGLDKLTHAFGMNNFLTGVASLIGPPISGALTDATGNYDASFVFSGLSMTVAGVLAFTTSCFKD